MLNLKLLLIFFCSFLCALTELDAANKDEPNSFKRGSGFLSKVQIGQKMKAGLNSVKERGSVLSSQFASNTKEKIVAGTKGLKSAKEKGPVLSSKFVSSAKEKIVAGAKEVKSLATPFMVKRLKFYSNFRLPESYRENHTITVNKDSQDIFEESLNAVCNYTEEVAKKENKSADEILKSKFLRIEMGYYSEDRITQSWITMLTNEIINRHEYFEFVNTKSDDIEINTKKQQTRTDWYRFFGRITALAIINRKMLPVCFSTPFLKIMLHREIVLNDLKDVKPNVFSMINNSPKMRIPDKKDEFIRSSIKELYISVIKRQMDAFMQGFNGLVPHSLIDHFSVNEFSQLICGTAMMSNKIYNWMNKMDYDVESEKTRTMIYRLWDVMKTFDTVESQKFLMFITGVPRVPPGGFGDINMLIERNACTITLPSSSNTLELPQDASVDTLASQLKNKMENLVVPIPIHRV